MRARGGPRGLLAALLLLLGLASGTAAQRAVPASEVEESRLIPPRPALKITVNDSLGLYEALLQAEGEDLTVLVQSKLSPGARRCA